MTLAVRNFEAFDMALSIPADELSACVDHGLNGIAKYCPAAVLPTAQWVLSARAQELGIGPEGLRSANGSCELIRCLDGWLALNLARETDWQLLNAWLETDAILSSWQAVRGILAGRLSLPLQERGREMGLPLARLESDAVLPRSKANPLSLDLAMALDHRPSLPRSLAEAKVVDLSALWAGPLCAHLLQRCGAQVTTVSSPHRPDGAQAGSPTLYEQLHLGHELLQLDFNDSEQRQVLAELLRGADVVIEASRPRALHALGLDRQALSINQPQIWLSITAYGRTPPADQWVGFGDDVAVSAGLVAWDRVGQPSFVGDALADPLTGVYSALAVIDAMARGNSGLLDFSMAALAQQCRQKIVRAGNSVTCPLEAAATC